MEELRSPKSFLDGLVGETLRYAVKLPDCELYDFGFGKWKIEQDAYGSCKESCTYVLHVICRFQIIWQGEDKHIDTYYEDSSHELFRCVAAQLMGLTVSRVALSSKNDLWLDLGRCWIVFATWDEPDESWRIFLPCSGSPHLVASSVQCGFDDEEI